MLQMYEKFSMLTMFLSCLTLKNVVFDSTFFRVRQCYWRVEKTSEEIWFFAHFFVPLHL